MTKSTAKTTDKTPSRVTKQDQIASLLLRDEGATLDQMVAATGALPHTTRAALSGLRKKGYGCPSPYRLAADPIEKIVCELIAAHLSGQVSSMDEREQADRLASTLAAGAYRQRRELIIERVRKVTIRDASLTLLLNDGTTLERSVERVRHGNDATLIVGELSTPAHKKADPQLIVLLQDAHRAQALALSKPNLSLEQLARTFGRSSERFKRLLRLSYLSLKLIEAVVEGRQPGRVTNRFLQNLDGIPLSWVAQEELLLR